MNKFKISDLKLGQREQFVFPITEEKMTSFMQLTGDINPLHVDESYAKDMGYKGRVVYGMLTASIVSTLGGVYLPGQYCLIEGVKLKFKKPVFIEDVLTVSGEIKRIEEKLKYIEIKITITNQNNQKVLSGLMKAGVMC